jgi:hypothetical protein
MSKDITPMTLIDQALAYRARGWSVIPTQGKKAVRGWKAFQSSPPDELTLRKLFAAANVTGMAVITGAVSGGLACRDIDVADAYFAWAEAHPHDAANTPTVKTRRGFHLYGVLDTEMFVKFDDGELRAKSSHYVILPPPSCHPEGSTYVWTVPLPVGDLPQLPSTLQSALCTGIQYGAATALITQGNPSNPLNTLHVSQVCQLRKHPILTQAVLFNKPYLLDRDSVTVSCSNWLGY